METPEFIAYMKESRQANKAWSAEFRQRYGIEEHKCDHLTPIERMDNSCYHAGYAECSH